MIRVKTILYPTDFSSYSNQAYFLALGLADAYGAALSVAYVYPPGQDTALPRSHWREQLEQIRPANRAIAVSHVFLEGDPATEIVRYAADAGIDVIVIGTHGRSGGDEAMGSVAERVTRDAACSVLVVKLAKGGRPTVERPAIVEAARDAYA